MKREQIARERSSVWLNGFRKEHFEIAPERIRPDADIDQDLDPDSIDDAEHVDRSVDIRAFREVRTLAQSVDMLER